MKSWIITLYLFSEALFFGTLALFSIKSSSSYALYHFIFAAVISIVFLFVLIQKSVKSNQKIYTIKILIVGLVVFLFMCILYSYGKFGNSPLLLSTIRLFVIYTIPAVILGLTVNEYDIKKIFNKISYINIYLSICFLVAFATNETVDGLDMFHGIAGATHLTIGYTMSTLFAFNFIKFVINKKILKKSFYLFLMVFNILLIILSGSRGALVSVLMVSFIMAIIYFVKKGKFFRLAFLIIAVSFISVLLINRNPNYSFAVERILSLFNSDFEQSSSGRDLLYNAALKNFFESPIYGEGIGSFSYEVGFYYYPHNIILEILNDFGLIGLLVFLFLSLKIFNKIIWILKQDITTHIIAFFFINVFIQMMFSGSYLVTSQLWLTGIIILTLNRKEFLRIASKETPFARSSFSVNA